MSMNGAVHSFASSQETVIDLQELSSGFYVLSFENNAGQRIQRKLIIE